MVGPHVGAAQRLADPLAVGVRAAALGAAHALVVQQVHGVGVARLALQAPLRTHGDRRRHCGEPRFTQRQERLWKPLKKKKQTKKERPDGGEGWGSGGFVSSQAASSSASPPGSGWQERPRSQSGIRTTQGRAKAGSSGPDRTGPDLSEQQSFITIPLLLLLLFLTANPKVETSAGVCGPLCGRGLRVCSGGAQGPRQMGGRGPVELFMAPEFRKKSFRTASSPK